jgi:hypothetical protein
MEENTIRENTNEDMKIFRELESLGFFDWLKEKGFGIGFTSMLLDQQPYDSIERTGYNSIVLRWFREKLGIHSEIICDGIPNEWYVIKYFILSIEDTGTLGPFDSYEKSEYELIKSLIGIMKSK